MKASLPILVLLLLASAGLSPAQNLIFFQKTDSKSYLIRHGDGGPSQGVTDHFIRTLSQGNGKPLNKTELVLVHDEYLRATKISPSEFQVYGTIQALHLNGDTRYRGFEVMDLMKPSTVKFTLERLGPQGRVMSFWDFNSVPLDGEPAVVANFRGQDSLVRFEDHTFRFRDLSFIYAPADKAPFVHRTQLIDDYYASVPELEVLYQELKKIDPEQIEQLNVHETDLRRLRSQIETIRAGGYQQQLGLDESFDPAGFLPRFREVDAFAAELGTRIRDNKANLHLLYYRRGLAHLENGNRPKALNDLQAATQMQPTFAPAHVAMARLRYQEGDQPTATDILLQVFTQLQPDPETRGQGAALARTIYQNYLGNADYALKQKLHSNALKDLDAAAALCGNITELDCSPQLEKLLGQAHTAALNELLTNAEKSLSAGSPEEAIELGLYARSYARENAAYVSDTSGIPVILNEAYRVQFRDLLGQVELLLGNGGLEGAEEGVARARAFREAHRDAIPDDSELVALENKVADRRYKALIMEGMNLAGQNKWNQALGQYETAAGLETRYEVQRDGRLPELIQATARAMLRQEIGGALELARSNRLREARDMRLAIDGARKRYGLQADPDVQPLYQELKDAIFNQECTNAQTEVDRLLGKAREQAAARDFLSADDTYSAALDLINANQPCGMDRNPAESGKTGIAPAVAYQRKLQEVERFVDRALHREAIQAYLAAGQAYEREDLGGNYGLQHLSLFDYVHKSGRNEFLRFGVDYFAGQEAYDQAIVLLRELMRRRYPKGRLKPVMIRIGQTLAVRDFQADPGTDPKVKGLNYTNGDKGLKKLYKAYCKQWKQMR